MGASRHCRNGLVGQGEPPLRQGCDRIRRCSARSLSGGQSRRLINGTVMPHFTAIALAAALTSPVTVDLSGDYVVQGGCPDPANNAYRGTLRIQSQPNRPFY